MQGVFLADIKVTSVPPPLCKIELVYVGPGGYDWPVYTTQLTVCVM